MHGRRSFSFVQSRELAELSAIYWAIESMNSMRKDKIIFESSCECARSCFLTPSSCSGAMELVGKICDLVQRFQHWSLDHVLEARNVIAQRIATSVVNKISFLLNNDVLQEDYIQSRWAVGEGCWACEGCDVFVVHALVIASLSLSVVSSNLVPDEEPCSGVPDGGKEESTSGCRIGMKVWG
ncbi:hypothetical protein F2Q70_00012478 [Brassica cretica]|uniref:RNase H type-1 domain-containing protein n=1 Tax=Brassica cretica TaxID=69181 RepID=A0A8S9M6U5_BRACR|nr:hypothetical protein F2Q70_00012478 [Brassica cretica]